MFFHSVLNVEVAIPDDIQQLLPEVKQDENDVVNENNSAKSKACDDDGEELAQKLMGLLSYSR
ncbi:MAG: hypothetical protein HWD59_04275 [Coxiellaceae bacterium]|nr:MAG: hypothetical protein HWD59_04275 [Coxiellaceae bacterium]